MTKPAKLYASLLANPNQIISFSAFIALVEAFGFRLRRQKGSHRVYKHPACPLILNLQPRGNEAKDYQVKEFLRYVEAYGLSLGE